MKFREIVLWERTEEKNESSRETEFLWFIMTKVEQKSQV